MRAVSPVAFPPRAGGGVMLVGGIEKAVAGKTAHESLIEDLAVATKADALLREVILDEGLSWTLQYGLIGKRERRLHWLYVLALPFFLMLVAWSIVRYVLYITIKRPTDPIRRKLGPESNLMAFDQAHWLLERTRNGVTSWTALAAIYSSLLVLKAEKGCRKWVAWFWFTQPEAQAVRNRVLEVLDNTYHHLVKAWLNGEKDLWVLSLACGSAQATIDALWFFLRDYPDARTCVRLVLVDKNEESLELALQVAESRGLSGLVEVCCEDIATFAGRVEFQNKFIVVENSGFLDYRGDSSFVRTCNSGYRLIRPGGLYIAAQIGPSLWAMVTRWITGWPGLIRRDQRTFQHLMYQTEFAKMPMRFIVESNGIYRFVFCEVTA